MVSTQNATFVSSFYGSQILYFFIALTAIFAACSNGHAQTLNAWFGTTVVDDDGLAKGIYHATINPQDGKLVSPKLAIELPSPGFLAVNPNPALNHEVLYATTNMNGAAVIASLKVQDDHSLSVINSVPIGSPAEKAGGACHVAVDATGRLLVSAQYGSGTAAVFAINDDGSIKERTQLIRHSGGSKVVGKRQDSPHAHYCGFDNENKFAFICDLGLDRVMIYRIDHDNGKLIAHGEAVCEPGGGPRHMKFHQSGKYAIVLNELAMTLSVFDYDASAGSMKLKQTVKTITDETKAHEMFNSGSEIVIHPNGKFVYSANRGNDTISVFNFNEADGLLTRVQIEAIRGSWPRNFNLTPDGKWLVAAGQNSNTATTFSINPDDGRLTFARASRFVPHPICVVFTPTDDQ